MYGTVYYYQSCVQKNHNNTSELNSNANKIQHERILTSYTFPDGTDMMVKKCLELHTDCIPPFPLHVIGALIHL